MKIDLREHLLAIPFVSDTVTSLSLDLMLPFYGPVGLDFTGANEIQSALRGCVLRHLEAFDTVLPRPQFLFLYDVLETFQRIRSDRFVDSFWNWLFETSASPVITRAPRSYAWESYWIVMRWWARLFKRNEARVYFGPQSSHIAELIRPEVTRVSIAQQIREITSLPLSEWDNFLFERLRYNNDELLVRRTCEAADNPVALRYPFDDLENMVGRNEFQIHWEEVLSILDDQEIEHLHEYALDLQERLELRPKPLPHPLELRRPLWWDS